MTPQKTKVQILDDVVKHIKKQGGRAVDEKGDCLYLTRNGRTCGHSMALNPSKRKLFSSTDSNSVIRDHGDEVHKKKYQGHEPEFWAKIQDFHDWKEHWTNEGEITNLGKNKLKELKEQYSQ